MVKNPRIFYATKSIKIRAKTPSPITKTVSINADYSGAIPMIKFTRYYSSKKGMDMAFNYYSKKAKSVCKKNSPTYKLKVPQLIGPPIEIELPSGGFELEVEMLYTKRVEDYLLKTIKCKQQ